MFCVKWTYNESGTDFAIFGPFASYEKADEWATGRKGKVMGVYIVLGLAKPD